MGENGREAWEGSGQVDGRARPGTMRLRFVSLARSLKPGLDALNLFFSSSCCVRSCVRTAARYM